MFRLPSRRVFLLSSAAFGSAPLVASGIWYGLVANQRQKELVQEIGLTLPDILSGGGFRFFKTLYSGLIISVDYKFNLRGMDSSTEEYSDTISKIHSRSAERLLKTCLWNGGLYIKFGQGLVSMNHVLPKEYLDILKVLQDRCLSRRSDHEVDEIFEKDLGKRPEEVFAEFDREPIAAASLAQVFKAKTLDGETVAVKVQYADLRERFNSDVPTMQAILNMMEIMHPKFGFAWVLKELKGTMAKELDFFQEGRNAERCRKDLENLDLVYVPDVHWNFCSQRILTTEFIEGIKISETKDLKEAELSLENVDQKLIEIFSEQIFHSGFVHADPHPGKLNHKLFL